MLGRAGELHQNNVPEVNPIERPGEEGRSGQSPEAGWAAKAGWVGQAGEVDWAEWAAEAQRFLLDNHWQAEQEEEEEGQNQSANERERWPPEWERDDDKECSVAEQEAINHWNFTNTSSLERLTDEEPEHSLLLLGLSEESETGLWGTSGFIDMSGEVVT